MPISAKMCAFWQYAPNTSEDVQEAKFVPKMATRTVESDHGAIHLRPWGKVRNALEVSNMSYLRGRMLQLCGSAVEKIYQKGGPSQRLRVNQIEDPCKGSGKHFQSISPMEMITKDVKSMEAFQKFVR